MSAQITLSVSSNYDGFIVICCGELSHECPTEGLGTF